MFKVLSVVAVELLQEGQLPVPSAVEHTEQPRVCQTEQRENALVAEASDPFVFGGQSHELVAFQVVVVEPAAAHSFQVHQQDATVEALDEEEDPSKTGSSMGSSKGNEN